MDREEYMKLKSECFIDIAKSSTACACSLSKEFGEVFDRAYNLGKKHASEENKMRKNTEEIVNNFASNVRLQVAMAAMQGLVLDYSALTSHFNTEGKIREVVKKSLMIADALIAEVSKKGGEE